MALTTVSQHQIALTILLFTFLVAIKANSFCRTFLIAPYRGFAFNPLVTKHPPHTLPPHHVFADRTQQLNTRFECNRCKNNATYKQSLRCHIKAKHRINNPVNQ